MKKGNNGADIMMMLVSDEFELGRNRVPLDDSYMSDYRWFNGSN